MKSLMRSFGVVALLAVASVLAGCPASNPVKVAQSYEQKSFALYGSYVIYQGKAAELKQDSAVPDKVKEALSAADRVAYPVSEKLIDAVLDVGHIRDLLDQCPALPEPDPACVPTNEQRLANALVNLSTIYFTAQPALLGLINAVKEAK